MIGKKNSFYIKDLLKTSHYNEEECKVLPLSDCKYLFKYHNVISQLIWLCQNDNVLDEFEVQLLNKIKDGSVTEKDLLDLSIKNDLLFSERKPSMTSVFTSDPVKQLKIQLDDTKKLYELKTATALHASFRDASSISKLAASNLNSSPNGNPPCPFRFFGPANNFHSPPQSSGSSRSSTPDQMPLDSINFSRYQSYNSNQEDIGVPLRQGNLTLFPMTTATSLFQQQQQKEQHLIFQNISRGQNIMKKDCDVFHSQYSSLIRNLPFQDYSISRLANLPRSSFTNLSNQNIRIPIGRIPVSKSIPEVKIPIPLPPVFIRKGIKEIPENVTKKNRRSRTVFTELQLAGLEDRFEAQKYLSTPDRIDLAKSLDLSQLQVKTWYQNRRMKWKKQVMQDGCKDPPTKPKGRPKKNSVPSFAELQRMQILNDERKIQERENDNKQDSSNMKSLPELHRRAFQEKTEAFVDGDRI